MNKQGFAAIFIMVAAVAVLGGTAYYLSTKKTVKAPVGEEIVAEKDCGTMRGPAALVLAGLAEEGSQFGAKPTEEEKATAICFDKAILDCSLASVVIEEEGESNITKVIGKDGTDCVLAQGITTGEGSAYACKLSEWFIAQGKKGAAQTGLSLSMNTVISVSLGATGGTYKNEKGVQQKFDCTQITQ